MIQTVGKRLADAVIVALLDRMHTEVVVAFAAQGYDILCETPMAESIEHCLQMEDAVKKGRISRGEGRPLAKLTDEAVREIRNAPREVRNFMLVEKFGISPSVISGIRNGKKWKHIV